MYVSGFLLSVPEGNKDAYKAIAEGFWDIAKDCGALSQVECREADVPDGQITDMRMAVKAEPGEKIVFSWVTWPSRAARDEGMKKFMEDPRMQDMQMPFDGKRMIYGGFQVILEA